ncbi:hypothetical protein HGA91_06650 [candidate division WWE3 bacterium]|nr:hypothetical protein [candidate division WWE3 bacterium]
MEGSEILRAGRRAVLIRHVNGAIVLTVGFASQPADLPTIPAGLEVVLTYQQAQLLSSSIREADRLSSGSYVQILRISKRSEIRVERPAPREKINLKFRGHTEERGDRVFWIETYSNQVIRKFVRPLERIVAIHTGTWYIVELKSTTARERLYDRLRQTSSARTVFAVNKVNDRSLKILTILADPNEWLSALMLELASSHRIDYGQIEAIRASSL